MHDLKPHPPERRSDERTILAIHDPVSLDQACRQALETARTRLREIEELPLDRVSVQTVLDSWDEVEILVEDVFGPVSLLNEVHPERGVREMADERMIDLSTFTTEIYQNRALFERVSAVETTTSAEAMLKKDLLEAFEDSGVSLDEEKRRRFREISHSITELSQEFAKNIREHASKIAFTIDELNGLPQPIIDSLERDGDVLLVGFDYPEYNPFMMNVHDEDARRRLFTGYLQRGGEQNLRILDEITELRAEMAGLYGLPTFAHYVTRRRMVRNPERVHSFLDEVLEAVQEREKRDLDELRRMKASVTGQPLESTTIYRWDVPYWSERVREQKFAVDQEKLREYFPVEPSIRWTLELSGRLYGVRFERVDVPVWSPGILYFDVIESDSDEFVGGIYMDLYPREGKYKHAAAWPVRGVSRRMGRKPLSALVTNFDRRGLTHHELETFLHEFGHVLHGVLSSTHYNMHSGTAVERDFVEAPSQMYEEWGRRLESLSIMKEICPECPQIDQDLVDRLAGARRFGKGIHYARQHLYASYDMTLAGGARGGSLDRWKQMEEQTSLGYVDGTMFPAAFGHITGGYAAGYYGYLWSETIANDLLAAFGDDIMNPETGRRFRDLILARGGEVEAQKLVEEFLGRTVSSEAFIRELREE
ncbi:MAG: Zn-dependent oligopeptidase [Acidobacteria bacterium]|nr:Zn-dependent oligopeptidase [Acidobacteriota bacterium]